MGFGSFAAAPSGAKWVGLLTLAEDRVLLLAPRTVVEFRPDGVRATPAPVQSFTPVTGPA